MKQRQPTELGRGVVRFFQDYLPMLRGMSLHTIRSYRDALVLLLRFAARETQAPNRGVGHRRYQRRSRRPVPEVLGDASAKTASPRATPGLPRSIPLPVSWSPNTRASGYRSSAFSASLSSAGPREAPVEYLESRPRSQALLASIDRKRPGRAARLRLIRPHVQHRRPGPGDPEPSRSRSAARTTLSGPVSGQGQQGAAVSDLAAHRASCCASSSMADVLRRSRRDRPCSPIATAPP